MELDQGWVSIFFWVEFTATSSSSAPVSNGALYTPKSTEMVGFFVKAQVNAEFLNGYSMAYVSLHAQDGAEPASSGVKHGGAIGEVTHFSGVANDSPFHGWPISTTGKWTANSSGFSSTAKLNVEYIDRTATTGYVQEESNATIPRFTMFDSTHANDNDLLV